MSLCGKLRKFPLAERTRYAVVRCLWNLGWQLVDLGLCSTSLHHLVHFSSNLYRFLELIWLLTPFCLFFCSDFLCLLLALVNEKIFLGLQVTLCFVIKDSACWQLFAAKLAGKSFFNFFTVPLLRKLLLQSLEGRFPSYNHFCLFLIITVGHKVYFHSFTRFQTRLQSLFVLLVFLRY